MAYCMTALITAVANNLSHAYACSWTWWYITIWVDSSKSEDLSSEDDDEIKCPSSLSVNRAVMYIYTNS